MYIYKIFTIYTTYSLEHEIQRLDQYLGKVLHILARAKRAKSADLMNLWTKVAIKTDMFVPKWRVGYSFVTSASQQ